MFWIKHSQYLCIKESQAIRIGDPAVSDQEAALCHIGAFPLAAIRKCRLEIGESAMVMGLGILGLMAVNQLRAAGAAPMVAVDPVESRRRRALELGAHTQARTETDSFPVCGQRPTISGRSCVFWP